MPTLKAFKKDIKYFFHFNPLLFTHCRFFDRLLSDPMLFDPGLFDPAMSFDPKSFGLMSVNRKCD